MTTGGESRPDANGASPSAPADQGARLAQARAAFGAFDRRQKQKQDVLALSGALLAVAERSSAGVTVSAVASVCLVVVLTGGVLWSLMGRVVPEVPPAATSLEIATPGGLGFPERSPQGGDVRPTEDTQPDSTASLSVPSKAVSPLPPSRSEADAQHGKGIPEPALIEAPPARDLAQTGTPAPPPVSAAPAAPETAAVPPSRGPSAQAAAPSAPAGPAAPAAAPGRRASEAEVRPKARPSEQAAPKREPRAKAASAAKPRSTAAQAKAKPRGRQAASGLAVRREPPRTPAVALPSALRPQAAATSPF